MRSDPRYRRADGALIYLLQLNTPRLVSQVQGLGTKWSESMERKILATVERLFDPRSGGFKRYHGDSYQRVGFFRAETVRKLNELYGGPSGDASAQFNARDSIVPKGPEAAWTHFTWQLSAWAGRRYRETGILRYYELQQRYMAEGMRTITRRGMRSLEIGADGAIHSISIPGYRFPECYLTEIGANRKALLFPSPHTPLNWAAAEALDAFGQFRINSGIQGVL